MRYLDLNPCSKNQEYMKFQNQQPRFLKRGEKEKGQRQQKQSEEKPQSEEQE